MEGDSHSSCLFLERVNGPIEGWNSSWSTYQFPLKGIMSLTDESLSEITCSEPNSKSVPNSLAWLKRHSVRVLGPGSTLKSFCICLLFFNGNEISAASLPLEEGDNEDRYSCTRFSPLKPGQLITAAWSLQCGTLIGSCWLSWQWLLFPLDWMEEWPET